MPGARACRDRIEPFAFFAAGLPRDRDEGWPGIGGLDGARTIGAMRRSALVVDDHRGFRAEARELLEGDGFEVVGETGDAAGAVREAGRLRPDLVVLDIGLPDASGLDVVVPIRAASPTSLVVLVSGRPAGDYGDRVEASGADAFVEKAWLAPGVLSALLE